MLNLFVFHKFDPSLPWSEYEIELKNEWTNPYSNYPNFNNKSNFSISIPREPRSSDNRYYGISSADNMVDNNADDENSESMEENANI